MNWRIAKKQTAEGIISMKIDTEAFDKEKHAEIAGSDFLPRVFYFILYCRHKKDREYKPVYIYPEEYGINRRNDSNIIALTDDSAGEGEADKANKEKLKKRRNYFLQLKVAKETLLNRSLSEAAPVVIGEALEKEENRKCVCRDEYKLPWGRKISCEARKKVVEICKELWSGNHLEMARELMICMAMETGETFNPAINTSGATGLIQFTNVALSEMNDKKHNGKYNEGTTVTKEDLKSMTVERQLDYVKYYFKMNMAAGKNIANALDMYMCIFCPVAVGKADNFVCYSKGTLAYSSNASVDGERFDEKKHRIEKGTLKGEIQKKDLLPRYKEKKWRG
ncbi:MAG: hypothetical protein LBK94_12655, partial [Prevotellaceae bacterium]|nr:hypothetical protein [Prevotellaceae bacterium]